MIQTEGISRGQGWLIFEKSKTSELLKADRSSLNWAAVVAQLAEQSLPKPEICGSDPNIGK